MSMEGSRGARAGGRPERGDLLREAAMMVLYVSVIEIAELAALPERHMSDGSVTGPVGAQLLAIVWGTAVGLALAHWFAFELAAHGLRGDVPTRCDVQVGLVQVAAAAFVAATSSVPVLFLSDLRAQQITGDVPAVIVGVISYAVARTAGHSRMTALFLGMAALALGVAVALVKNKLAAH
jgi:hypothetical protein